MRGENNGGRFGFGEIAERAEYCGYMARGCGNLGADLPRKRGLKPGFCSVGQYDAKFVAKFAQVSRQQGQYFRIFNN